MEQSSVEDDAAADTGRDDHADEVTLAGRGTPPAFTDGEGLGIVVDVGRQVEQRAQ